MLRKAPSVIIRQQSAASTVPSFYAGRPAMLGPGGILVTPRLVVPSAMGPGLKPALGPLASAGESTSTAASAASLAEEESAPEAADRAAQPPPPAVGVAQPAQVWQPYAAAGGAIASLALTDESSAALARIRRSDSEIVSAMDELMRQLRGETSPFEELWEEDSEGEEDESCIVWVFKCRRRSQPEAFAERPKAGNIVSL